MKLRFERIIKKADFSQLMMVLLLGKVKESFNLKLTVIKIIR